VHLRHPFEGKHVMSAQRVEGDVSSQDQFLCNPLR
jgi:hypothetical protein